MVVCDSGAMGGECSSAGAGMLSPGGEFDKPSVWIDLAIEGMAMYPAFVEELAGESGVGIDFKIVGCRHFVDAETARRRVEFQRGKGIAVELTSDGLIYPRDAFVDPTDLLRALRRASKAEVRENSAIGEIEAAEFDAMVIAAGAWSDRIRVKYRGRALELPAVKPVKGHLAGFDFPPGSLGTMLRRGHSYVLQRSNGFTIAGATEEDAGFDRSVSEGTAREIQAHAAELWPALRDAVASRKWIGFRPFSAAPNIGRVEGTNVWLAYGHYRNGILLAPLTAEKVAGEMAG